MRSDGQESLQHIKLLLDALNCGAALISRDGSIVYVNQRLCRMIQRPCSALIGTRLEDLYNSDDDRKHIRDALLRFDDERDDEFFLPLPDAKRLPIVYSSKRVPGEPPLSDHRVITLIDISRQKEAETAMRENYEFIVQMSDTVLQQALELKHYSESLEERVMQRTAELHEAHMEAVYMLAIASEAKDLDTGRHVRRIQHYSRALAEELGLPSIESDAIGYSAILHDIGKIHVPDRILSKPGPLDDDERRQMQQHTIAGERILAQSAFFERARKIARSHHENWDGSGYPDGLSGERIPLEARIVHVADVFDALTTSRAYKDSWTQEHAVQELVSARGRMFEARIVDALQTLVRSDRFRSNGG